MFSTATHIKKFILHGDLPQIYRHINKSFMLQINQLQKDFLKKEFIGTYCQLIYDKGGKNIQ